MSVVIIPTYNEAANIVRLLMEVRAVLPDATCLIVDDASPDGTADLAEQAGARVLRRAGPRGLGPAYRDGFRWAIDAGYTWIYQMDADFSHDPRDLLRLKTGADLTIGSRYVKGGGTRNWAVHRRVLSRFGSGYARRILGVDVQDLTGGFKCWRAATLARIHPETLQSDGYAFQIEATYRAMCQGAQVVEVPIIFTERREGASKMSGQIALEAALRVPLMRWGGV